MLRHVTAAILFCFGWFLATAYIIEVLIKGMRLEMKGEFAFTQRSVFVGLVELSILVGGLLMLALSAYAFFDKAPGSEPSIVVVRILWVSIFIIMALLTAWLYLR